MSRRRSHKILTFEELERLTTPRLLAYKNSLYKVPEGPSNEVLIYGEMDNRFHKQRPEWKVAVASVKAVLAKREHVDDVA